MIIKTLLKTTATALIMANVFAISFAQTVYAAPVDAEAIASSVAKSENQNFIKKKYKIKGQWKVIQENGQTVIRFSDDFKTKKGPDLKIFLSPQSVGDVTGETAINGAINIGVLKSNKGAQDYILPAGVSLTDFSSVLIHCEAYSVLWGGGNL